MKGIKIALNPVGAGLKRPPEQSADRKDFTVLIKIAILFFAATDYKIQLPYGRARRPAPTTTDFIFSTQPRLRGKPPIPSLTSNLCILNSVPPAPTTTNFVFPAQPREIMEPVCTASNLYRLISTI